MPVIDSHDVDGEIARYYRTLGLLCSSVSIGHLYGVMEYMEGDRRSSRQDRFDSRTMMAMET